MEKPGSHACIEVDVSILVVSYNTKDLTLKALRSVISQTRVVTAQIIVVDNNSSDGSPKAIRDEFPEIRLIELKKNIGFAAANNLASTFAHGRYILLLNPDTVVLDRAIDKLVAFAKRQPDALIWGGRTLFADKSLNPSSCWGRMTPWTLLCRACGLTAIFKNNELFNAESFGGWKRDTERHVDIVSGCFFLIERQVWNKLGGFAPLFFMYGEEADLCLRAKNLGASPMITPEATIIHIGGSSEAVRSDKMIKLLAAKATLIERHFKPLMRPVGLVLLNAWPLSRSWASAILASMTGSKHWSSSAQTWRKIWHSRQMWNRGYPMRNSKALLKAEHASTGAQGVIRA